MTKATNTKQIATPAKKTKTTVTKRKVTPVKKSKVSKKAAKASYSSMSMDDLVAALLVRDVRIAELEERLEKESPKTKVLDPAVVEQKLDKLRKQGKRMIKAQMKWKPSMARGANGCFSWSSFVEEAVFRAFMGYTAKDKKTKGKRVSSEQFEKMMGDGCISKSLRYSTLFITSKNVTISYGASGEMKVTGKYGLPMDESDSDDESIAAESKKAINEEEKPQRELTWTQRVNRATIPTFPDNYCSDGDYYY